MTDFLLYWLCAAFLALPSALILPVAGAMALGFFASGFWFCALLNNENTKRKET